MPLYRFYRIVSTAGEECYVGSTTWTLSHRFSGHKAHHKRGRGTASCIIFAKYGVDTCSIILISEQEMEKTDAMREERRLIEEYPTAVNKLRPIIEQEERQQEKIEYDQKRWKEQGDALNTKKREKIPCDVCETLSSRTNMARHKRTKACQAPK